MRSLRSSSCGRRRARGRDLSGCLLVVTRNVRMYTSLMNPAAHHPLTLSVTP